MIRTMITKWIQEKQKVTICCNLGRDQYAYFQGTIIDYRMNNDTIRVVCPHLNPYGALIPMAAIHTIVAASG